jgi:hypothetical protein
LKERSSNPVWMSTWTTPDHNLTSSAGACWYNRKPASW